MNTLKLKSARISKGLRQNDIAINIGMTAKSYNHKENQKKELRLSEVVAIAKTLKLTPKQCLEIFFDEILTECISPPA